MTTATAKSRARAKKATQKKGSATKPTKPDANDRASRRARQLAERNARYEGLKASLNSKLRRRARSTQEIDQDECRRMESEIIRVEHEQLHAQDHLIEMVPPGFFDGKRDLSKTFTVIAKNIEDSLVKSGAEAGIDYTYLDLYKLAAPFILVMFQDKDADEIGFDAENF
jgi:hypothetical protein